MSKNPNIAKNTSWFTVALIIQKIIAFVYFTYLARILGVESIGQYVFALSYITIFAVVINLGTNHFITREVAKDKSQTQKLTSNIFGFKLISSVLGIVIAMAIAYLLSYDPELIRLLYIAMAVMVVESFVLSIYAIIRGFHNLKYESVTTIIVHVIILVLGILAAKTTNNVGWLLAVLLIGHGSNLIFGLIILKKRFSLKLKFGFNFKYWKKIALVILPFALAATFSKVWGAFDQVIMAKLSDPLQLGYYGVAYKLTFALQFLPLALMAALYPAMSRLYTENKEKLSELFSRSVNYLLIITIPLIGGIFIFGYQLINSLYTSDFQESVFPLQILFISLPFLFLNFPLGSLLNACNMQKRQSINIGVAMITNIVLNIILIPKFDAVGAAWASLVSNVVYFAMGWSVLNKIIKFNYKENILVLVKIIIATTFMVVVSLFINQYVYWFISVVFVSILYFVVLYMLKTFSNQEIKQFLTSFRK